MRAWWNRFRAWISGRGGISDDLAEELRSHLNMEIEAALEEGIPAEEARQAAHRRVGNTVAHAEQSREAWGFPPLDSFLGDVRYGLRALRLSKGFALTLILTFALGVGVNTAIFSVLNTVVLKPLPYPHAERLLWLGETAAKAQGISVTWGNFQAWNAASRTFEEMAAYQFTGSMTLTGRGDPLNTSGMMVTFPYFGMVGMRPLLGRTFGAADDRPGAPQVIVLNHRFWAGTLGADPHIIGSTLTLNGNSHEVVGVAAPLWEPWRVDYYVPLGRAAGANTDRRQHGSIRAIGRMKPGVTLAQAQADLDTIMSRLAEADPGPENEHRAFGRFLGEFATGEARGPLFLLMAAAGLVLLIACANVASLLLARNTTRAGEFAVRKAIGAGELRLVRQLLTETIVLAVLGGTAGVGFAQLALRALLDLAPRGLPRLQEATLDTTVLLFAAGITLVAGLVAGTAPMLAAGRVDLATALKEGAARGISGGGHRQTFRSILVVGEIALTFVLSFGSGLLLRSLIAAQHADPGFDPRRVLLFSLQLPDRAYRTREATSGFYTRLLDDLRATPGVEGAAITHCPPGWGDCGDWFYSIPDRPAPAQSEVPIALFNNVGPGYFHTLKTPLLDGRELDAADRDGGAKVAIVNRTFARTWWPNERAVGRQIKVGGPYQKGPTIEVVGVAEDLRQSGLDSEPLPEIFQPASQSGDNAMAIVVRAAGSGDLTALMPAVRGRVRALDRNLPVKGLEPIEQSLGAGLARRRFSTMLLTLFAALAMLLAAVGIYGLLSYWVSSRESEIAIRLALGARQDGILGWAGMHALRLAAIGIAFGVAGGWVAARGLEEMVFGVPPRSPAMLAAAAAAVAALALAAAAVPAWRASRVDPARRLHSA